MPNVYPANPPNMDVRITKSAAEQLALDLSEEMNARIAADNVLRAEIDAIEVPEIPIGIAGFNEYLSVTDSTVSGYDTVSLSIDAAETEVAISATNATVWGMKYLSESTLKTTTIPAGSWAFNYNRKVSSTTSTTSLMIRAFVRHSNGTEDVLFTLTSPSIEETTYQPRVIDYSLAAFTVATTDRLGFQIGMVTTRLTSTTLTYIVGDGRGFFIRSPLAIEHNNLLGRSENDAHPQSAITGLVSALASKWSASNDGPGSGLDADTVSGYGIGVTNSTNLTTDLNTLGVGGIYVCSYDVSQHFPIDHNGHVIVLPAASGGGGYFSQIFISQFNGRMFRRTKQGGVFLAPAGADANGWVSQWDAISDGNGGQPPAPKANRTSAATAGYFQIDDYASASQSMYTPYGNGTWKMVVLGYNQTTSIGQVAIVAGSASVVGTTSQTNTRILWERISA